MILSNHNTLTKSKKTKKIKKGGAPFCPKARLAAVAQQNHYKPYKKKIGKKDSTPFCPKARLAAVAQQNHSKLYKREMNKKSKQASKANQASRQTSKASKQINGLAGFPKGLQ